MTCFLILLSITKQLGPTKSGCLDSMVILWKWSLDQVLLYWQRRNSVQTYHWTTFKQLFQWTDQLFLTINSCNWKRQAWFFLQYHYINCYEIPLCYSKSNIYSTILCNCVWILDIKITSKYSKVKLEDLLVQNDEKCLSSDPYPIPTCRW